MEYSTYFLNNKSEFISNSGGVEKLMNALKNVVNKNVDSNIITLGIDIGACVGNSINMIKDVCSLNTSILLFEPNPSNYNTLEKLITNNLVSNCKLFKNAVSDKNYNGEIFNNINLKDYNQPGNEHASLKETGHKISDIEIVTLESVLDKEYNSDNIIIQCIKIDTEGHDINVIKGIGKYLKNIEYMIFEASDCLDDYRGPNIDRPLKYIVDFLSKNGFDTYKIGKNKLIKINDEYWDEIYETIKFWSDCFAIKKTNSIINTIIDNEYDYKYY